MDEVARFFSGSVPLGSILGQQNHFAPVTPHLTITNQKSHSEEVISKNGIQKTIHIVVKNSPFHIQVGLSNYNACKLDFNQIAFEAFLLYDCEGDKEVDFVKVKPMEFKSVASEDGRLLDTELRIKVLTSQHEDMLFKIRIAGSNPLTHEEIPGLSIISGPIKVISKPEQLKKKQPSKKRTLTDLLVDTVGRIEKKQEEQQKLIEKLILQQTEQAQVVGEKKQKLETVSWEDLNLDSIPSDKREKSLDFEDTFVNLIKAYNGMKAEEKPETIRKLIRNSSTRDTERLSELLDLFWTEGLQKELGGRTSARDRSMAAHAHMKEDGCNCVDCPHKLELERIDEFYKEFLSSGVTSVAPEYS